MNFENCFNRISSLNDCDYFQNPETDTRKVLRLNEVHSKMQKNSVTKTKFSQFSDKRFYFSDGITALPLSHPYLKDLNKYKVRKGQRTEKYFWHK